MNIILVFIVPHILFIYIFLIIYDLRILLLNTMLQDFTWASKNISQIPVIVRVGRMLDIVMEK